MKLAVYVAGLAGIALLVALVVGSDVSRMMQIALQGGWQLLWIIPYRTVFFFFYAAGWRVLLYRFDPGRRAGLGYLLWTATVREAIDRLLPVASVGGAVAGVRLVGWRGIPAPVAGATVIVETVLTLLSSWVFAVLGVTLAVNFDATATDYHRVIVVLALSLPIPLILAALLGSGSLFGRLQKLLVRFIGVGDSSAGGHSLDQALHSMLRRHGNLLAAGTLQFLALLSGAVEVWFALRLFGHPVSPGAALMLESMVQAFRHLAFMVPASLGVQETVLVVFGHSVGIGPETAIAVSLVKRLREVVYGLASLASWQWVEGQRLAADAANTVMPEVAARSGDLDA